MHSELTFFVLAGVAILSAALMISRTKTIYSSFFFVLTLLATSGIFFQLHSPLLLAAQFVAIAGVLIGIILFAVEVSKLDVALAAEHSWRPKAAAIAVAFILAAEVALALLQRRLPPGEKLTALLPRATLPWPLSAGELIKFFFTYDLLPLGLMLLALLIAGVGIGAVFQKRA